MSEHRVFFNGPKPTIVCLCGSTRFIDAWNEFRKRLTEMGEIVLAIEVVTTQSQDTDPQHVAPELKRRLDELHKRKIDLADYVLVLDVNGYIGESTRSEIAYAERHGKPIRYLSQWWKQPGVALSEERQCAMHGCRAWAVSGEDFCVNHQEKRKTARDAKLQDIKEHPERHRHDFGALQACCFVDGAIDVRLMEAHSAAIGRTNGGTRCDVSNGPCACGAWH